MKIRHKNRSLSRIAPLSVIWGINSPILLLIFATILLGISFTKPDYINGVRSGVTDIFSPALSIISTPFHAVVETVSSVSGLTEMRAENARLQAENARLREWYQTAMLLQAENQSLKKLLNLQVDPGHKHITARVIADSGNVFVKSLLLSTGQSNGVQKDQAVLSELGLIGRVMEAGQNSSRVLLLTDYNSRIPILIEGSGQHGILAGTNKGYAKLMHMPTDIEIKEGMRIITSGHAGVFPSGLPIGSVIQSEENTFVVKPFADLANIHYVRILDKPIDPNLRLGVVE